MKSNSGRVAARVMLVAGLVATFSACAPLVVGGAFVGTVRVATDRRTTGIQVEDEGIELKVHSRMKANLGERGHINVVSYNRQVLLTGEVPTAQDRELATQVAKSVENVKTVFNELGVMPSTSLQERAGDVLISSKVKAGLFDAKDISSNAFSVTVERDVVYLMGRVTQREADRATEIVRSIEGVKKVVRLFELITEDDLKQMLPQPVSEEKKQVQK